MDLFTKQIHRLQKEIYNYPRGNKVWGGTNQEVVIKADKQQRPTL